MSSNEPLSAASSPADPVLNAVVEPAETPDKSPVAAPKHVSPAMFGLLIMPFGVVSGLCGVALPRLLELAGETTAAIGVFEAISTQPHAWKFLIEPAIDARFRRRSWYLATVLMAAAIVPLSVLAFAGKWSIVLGGKTVVPLMLVAGLLFIVNAAIATSSGAMHALMATTLPPDQKGKAAGWAMAGNLGGSGLGGAIALFLMQKTPPMVAALGLSALMLGTAAPALWIREEARPSFPIFRAVGALLKDTWKTVKSKDGWLGLVICLCPVGCGGAMGLFPAIANPYGAGDAQVALVNGLFGGIISAIGCVVGGYAADRIDRRVAYVLAGGLCAAFALAMSFAPLVPTTYTVGCLAYSFANGIAYATWCAFVLDLMGHDSGVATKHALYAAAANQATSYMTALDGLAGSGKIMPKLFGEGPKAILRFDAFATVVGVVIIAGMVILARRIHPRPPRLLAT